MFFKKAGNSKNNFRKKRGAGNGFGQGGGNGCGHRHRHGQQNETSGQINNVSSFQGQTMPMNVAPANVVIEIVSYFGCGNLAHRLAELGLGIGSRIVITQSSGSGPVILDVEGSRIALGHRMTERILVRPVTS